MKRRDMLKLAAAAAAAGTATAQEPLGPFDRPTRKFDKAALDRLPDWAFRNELKFPPVPRPMAVGSFEKLTENGARPFGETDPVPIGSCFHGIAREWGETPEHWKAYGCSVGLTPAKAWEDKRAHFGTIPSYLDPNQKVDNWGGFPIKCFKVPIVEALVPLRPDAAFPARAYTYAGRVPGPTLKLRLGQPLVVRYENHLETEVSIHLHGGHSPSHSDGFPSFYVLQGKSRDYFYPNILPLKEKRKAPGDKPVFEPDLGESQSTMWYHDHGMDATAYNVSKGLAGFAICLGERELKLIHDKVLPGLGPASCIDPERDKLETDATRVADLEDPEKPGFYKRCKEPYYNPYDLPIVLQDKVIDTATGQIAYDPTGHNGYLGDTILLNGVAWPKLCVENRKYRFRFLDGSNARIYRLRLLSEADYLAARDRGIDDAGDAAADPQTLARRATAYEKVAKPFLRIGKDSWLWAKAVTRKSVLLAMANRADLVVDFKSLAPDLKAGEKAVFYLVNTMPQADGRGPKVKLDDAGDPRVLPLPFDTAADPATGIPATTVAEMNRPMPLMKIIVEGPPCTDDATVECGTELNPHEPIEDHEVRAVREFIFERGKGAWQINGRFYDPTVANATPTLGTAEEWVLRNGGGGWWHPIHIHLESHQLIGYEKDFDADNVLDANDPPARTTLANRKDVLRQIDEVEQRGLHDTQVLGPNTVARIRMRFRTWSGPFVFHCHNLEHEDMRMMFNFEPVPRGDGPDGSAARVEANAWANLAPDARTHGDDVTLQPDGLPRRVGELPWEVPAVPGVRAEEAGEQLIRPRQAP